MIEEQLVFQGIPLWLLREYLVELGGEVEHDHRVVADGWTADIAKIEPFKIGSLVIGRVQLILHGEPDAIALMRPGLEQKTIRAGA